MGVLYKKKSTTKKTGKVKDAHKQVKVKRAKKKSFFESVRSIKIAAPADFSTNVDEYLYEVQ